MPTTVNGIGTHYYGKKNRETREATCQQCGYTTTLESYDTRLWFVVLYVPVIPLGRKRIIDQCAACQRHWVFDQDKWEMQKQLSVSGALDRYESDPTPDAALEAHAYLLSFRQHEKAKEFLMAALERFPDNAHLQAGFGDHLEQCGRHDEADKLFASAYELQPEMPEARVGVAQQRMRDGKLDEARELMRFLEEPGSGQLYDLAPLNVLAYYYQQEKQHAEVIEICRHLVSEFPAAAKSHTFRAFVKTSEKALRTSESILPAKEFSLAALFSPQDGRYEPWQRWTAFGTVLAVVLIIGLAIHNEYRRRHRTVHVFNETGGDVSVAIDDGAPVAVSNGSTLVLSEGTHRVAVSGTVSEEFEIQLATGYFERWTHKPVWVLNPGSGAAFLHTTLHYAANPRPSEGEFLFGRFLYFPHVDYPFEPSPNSMSVPSENGEVTKIELGRSREPASGLFYQAVEGGDLDVAFDYAEAAIRRDPNDATLLTWYATTAQAADRMPRAVAFLAGKLWQTPLSISVHRMYQQLIGDTAEREQELIAKYDELLTADPASAEVLYLRGRVESVREAATEFFRRSTESAPEVPWGWYALAYHASSRGDWQEAKRCAERACQAAPQESTFQTSLHEARLGLGEFELLEDEYRRELARQPSDSSADPVVNLCEVLAAAGKRDEAADVLNDWLKQYPIQVRSNVGIQTIVSLTGYLQADFAEESVSFDQWNPEYRFHALLAASRPEEALQNTELKAQAEQPWNALGLSLAFILQGDADSSGQWRDKAIAAFDQGDKDDRRIAGFLQSDDAPTNEQVLDVTMHSSQRALLLAYLGHRFPAEGPRFLDEAERLNVRRVPPFHLVRRALHKQ